MAYMICSSDIVLYDHILFAIISDQNSDQNSGVTMGRATLALTDKSLKELSAVDVNQNSISHKDPGISGSLIAKRRVLQSEILVVFFFRNQSSGYDQTRQIGVWAGAGRNKNDYGITLKQALAIYREWGEIAKNHPDIKAYFEAQELQQKQAEEQIARLAEIEARKGTVAHLLEAYRSSLEGRHAYRETESVFRRLPQDFLSLYAKDVKPENVTKIISDYLKAPPAGGGIGNTSKTNASANKRVTGDKLRRYLQAAFNFGMQADNDPLHHVQSGKIFDINYNPAAAVKCIDPDNANTRALTHDELRFLLEEINKLSMLNRALALVHVYFGGQRIQQLFKVTWADINEKSILLIDKKGKGKTNKTSEHVLPITPRIQEIMSPFYAVNKEALGPFSLNGRILVNPCTMSDLFVSLNNSLIAQGKALKFSAKNIRVTCETYLSSQGVDKQKRAWLLSHGRSGVQDKHYDRYDHWQENFDLLVMWQGYLDSL